MSIAYPIRRITIARICGFQNNEVSIGSKWLTGNVLFCAAESGTAVQHRIQEWALGMDDTGRAYLLWKASHPKANAIVIQPMNSRYCFEVSPA